MAGTSYELIGTVKVIFATQTFGSGFTKREFVVTQEDDSEMGSKFPQYIKFGFTKDQCALLDRIKEGDRVKVSFAINGREWLDPKTNTTKYFVDLHAFRIESMDETGTSTDFSEAEPVMPADDDMPF